MARLPLAPDLPVDPLADRLILLYRAAERALDRLIVEALNRRATGTARYFQNQQARVTAILAQLEKRAAPLIPAVARSGYRSGVSAVDRVLDRSEAFSGVHTAAEEVIAANLEGRLRFAKERIGRSAQDAIRKASLEEVGIAIGAGLSPRQQTERLVGRLSHLDHEQIRKDGTTAFVDRRGRRWRLGVYAAMVARTTTREASSQGIANRLLEHGRDLVEISEHRRSCPICLPFQGKTFSLTGHSKNYPVLESLPPFHPNCRHVLLPARVAFEDMERALGLGPKEATAEGAREDDLTGNYEHDFIHALDGLPLDKALQPHRDGDAVYRQAHETEDPFQRLLDLGEGLSTALDAQEITPGEGSMAKINAIGEDDSAVVVAPLKDRRNADQKVFSEYVDREHPYENITDVVRGTVVVGREDDLPDAILKLRRFAADRGWQITRPRNRFLRVDGDAVHVGSGDEGYRDVNLNLVSPGGHVTEVQITTSRMFIAKRDRGHKLYEDLREIRRSAVIAGRTKLTVSERAEIARLGREMAKLYDAAR